MVHRGTQWHSPHSGHYWSARRPLLGIGSVELIASTGFGLVYAGTIEPLVAFGYAIVGFFSAPMTVWAQSMRMRRLAVTIRGRAFAALGTLMQATPPIGAALAAPLLVGGHFLTTVVLMVLLAGLPAVALLLVGCASAHEPSSSAQMTDSIS